MLRQLADQLSNSTRARRTVRKLFPDEEVLLSTSVTILETTDVEPIGWSLLRLLQRRGNVVITERRIYIQSSFFSKITFIWLGIAGYWTYNLLTTSAKFFNLYFLAIALMLVFQRRPYCRNLLFEAINDVRFGGVRGLTGRYDIFSIDLGERVIQLVSSQVIADELKQRLQILTERSSSGRKV